MKKKRIVVLIITDSLGYPRTSPEKLKYEQTYVSLLKNEFSDIDFIHAGKGGGRIRDLFTHSGYYQETVNPSLVIIQSGIVDCAPRALTFYEYYFVNYVPFIGSLVGKFVRFGAPVLRRWRKITYTSLDEFEKTVEKFEAVFRSVYWICIVPATHEYEANLPGITNNINAYNKILKEKRHIETDFLNAGDIMSDHHHLNAKGHEKMYIHISNVIRKNLS